MAGRPHEGASCIKGRCPINVCAYLCLVSSQGRRLRQGFQCKWLIWEAKEVKSGDGRETRKGKQPLKGCDSKLSSARRLTNNRSLFFTVLNAGSLKSGYLPGLVRFWWQPPSRPQVVNVSWCLSWNKCRRGKGAHGGLFYNGANPIHEAYILITVITSQNSQIPLHWKLIVNISSWGDTDLQMIVDVLSGELPLSP